MTRAGIEAGGTTDNAAVTTVAGRMGVSGAGGAARTVAAPRGIPSAAHREGSDRDGIAAGIVGRASRGAIATADAAEGIGEGATGVVIATVVTAGTTSVPARSVRLPHRPDRRFPRPSRWPRN